MILEFSGELIYWRGPAPWHFVTVPEPESAELQEVSGTASYGWGCIPVQARIGGLGWTTSLMPREGLYVVPVKAAIRTAEGLQLGDRLAVRLEIEDD
jgi:hypothetical protein